MNASLMIQSSGASERTSMMHNSRWLNKNALIKNLLNLWWKWADECEEGNEK